MDSVPSGTPAPNLSPAPAPAPGPAGIHNVQITPTLQIANAFTSFVYGLFDLFNGFYRPKPQVGES